jgi:glycogen(starch) synthase
MACADTVVAPTRTFLATLRDIYGALPNGRVIHNASAPEPFHGDDADGRLPIVFACGRFWDEAKNMRALDTAAKGLPWRVYAAGNSLAPDGRCSESQTLCCLGALAARDLAVWLQRAAIFAHPARYEPFGLAVLEAAQAGCALVLADLPGLRELWLDAALYVDPNDAGALHAALRELIEDPSQRALLGSAARERARAFVPDRMADEYHTLYRNLLSRQPAMERAIA